MSTSMIVSSARVFNSPKPIPYRPANSDLTKLTKTPRQILENQQVLIHLFMGVAQKNVVNVREDDRLMYLHHIIEAALKIFKPVEAKKYLLELNENYSDRSFFAEQSCQVAELLVKDGKIQEALDLLAFCSDDKTVTDYGCVKILNIVANIDPQMALKWNFSLKSHYVEACRFYIVGKKMLEVESVEAERLFELSYEQVQLIGKKFDKDIALRDLVEIWCEFNPERCLEIYPHRTRDRNGVSINVMPTCFKILSQLSPQRAFQEIISIGSLSQNEKLDYFKSVWEIFQKRDPRLASEFQGLVDREYQAKVVLEKEERKPWEKLPGTIVSEAIEKAKTQAREGDREGGIRFLQRFLDNNKTELTSYQLAQISSFYRSLNTHQADKYLYKAIALVFEKYQSLGPGYFLNGPNEVYISREFASIISVIAEYDLPKAIEEWDQYSQDHYWRGRTAAELATVIAEWVEI